MTISGKSCDQNIKTLKVKWLTCYCNNNEMVNEPSDAKLLDFFKSALLNRVVTKF